MKNRTISIKGIPVIGMYTSFDDDFWIITEIRKKGRPTIAYGFIKSQFSEEGHFGEFSLSDLKSYIHKDHIKRIPRSRWHLCPAIDGYVPQDKENS
jgi:hypothetical protein